jgi:hypothetical protein
VKGDTILKKGDEVFTEFEPALLSITTPLPGRVEDFIKLLQEKLDEHMETPPTNQTIERAWQGKIFLLITQAHPTVDFRRRCFADAPRAAER